jgi:hypothetical protein
MKLSIIKKADKPAEAKPVEAKIKRVYTLRFYMMVLSGIVSAVGLGLFVIYFLTLNIALGLPGIMMIAAGGFALKYYWNKEGDIAIESIGDKKMEDIVNSLNIYPEQLEFANVYEPQGFPMLCENLKRKFYVNIWDETAKRLAPFVLPDQQYCDPIVFAQRVLGLPAHRKIFERKPKLLQKLKTALLVLAIGIVWLLILTTTGS